MYSPCEVLTIHADNTGKETKNTIVMYFFAWFLANMKHFALREMQMIFLMCGHTHDLVDRFFSMAPIPSND